MNKRLSLSDDCETRVTMKTVAEAVGVSQCTVNKALTGKPRVSEEMRKRIIETAERLGYRRNRLARSLARPVIRIGVVCPAAWPAHFGLMLSGVKERLVELNDYRISSEFVEVHDMNDGIAFFNAIQSLIANKIDGLIIAPGDYTGERRQLLWDILGRHHTPFVLLGHVGDDGSPHLAAVEQNSQICGQWSAELLSLMTSLSSRLAILIGNVRIRDHRLKVEAFQRELLCCGARAPLVLETHDVPEQASITMKRLLQENSDIGGIYIGTENVQGACEAIESSGLGRKIRIVTTGISDYVLNKIKDRLIQASIYQQEPIQGKTAVDILFQYLETGCRPPLDNLIAPTLVMRSNINSFKIMK